MSGKNDLVACIIWLVLIIVLGVGFKYQIGFLVFITGLPLTGASLLGIKSLLDMILKLKNKGGV